MVRLRIAADDTNRGVLLRRIAKYVLKKKKLPPRPSSSASYTRGDGTKRGSQMAVLLACGAVWTKNQERKKRDLRRKKIRKEEE